MANLLEQSWAQREEDFYPELFGDIGEGICVLTFDIFRDQFGCDAIDPRWLHVGVFRSPPNERRDTWMYVSSGLSNPWETDEAERYSGLGVELVLETAKDQPWAIPLVLSLAAFNILLSVGKYGDRPLLEWGARISQPMAPNMAGLVLGQPSKLPHTFELVSGSVELLQIVGLTKEELAHAKQFGSDVICDLLQRQGVYPLTDPNRASIDLS